MRTSPNSWRPMCREPQALYYAKMNSRPQLENLERLGKEALQVGRFPKCDRMIDGMVRPL